MPHSCGGNRQAPSRHRRAYRVARWRPAPADPAPWRAVRHQPDDVPGCNVAVVPGARHRCVHDCYLSLRDDSHTLFDANHHLAADKALHTAHVNGMERVQDCGAGGMVHVLYGEREELWWCQPPVLQP